MDDSLGFVVWRMIMKGGSDVFSSITYLTLDFLQLHFTILFVLLSFIHFHSLQ
jgi:hypothetical protein